MRKTIASACLSVLALAGGAAHATNVGVSVEISQPGVYGRVDIGRFPQPAVIVPQPVIIGRPVVVAPEPVYMWVPPGHRKHWGRYCAQYRACGVPVYFVDHRWYDRHVMPVRYERREDRRDDRWDRREERRDDRWDDRRGPPGPRDDHRGPPGHRDDHRGPR
ncbi:MAG: hypothetical protein QM702_10160 [Rubrivivax sp.]